MKTDDVFEGVLGDGVEVDDEATGDGILGGTVGKTMRTEGAVDGAEREPFGKKEVEEA